MNKDILAFLAKTLNKPEDAVASLFNEDGSVKDNAISELTSWDANRVKSLKDKDQLTFDNGYKKAQGEVLTKQEKKLKETFALDTESTGDELISELKIAVASKNPIGEITEDVIKKHPAYLSLEKAKAKEVKEAKESADQKINEFTAEQTRKERFAQVAEKALEIVQSKNPILPSDAAKAKRRLTVDVVDPLKGYDYEINGDEIVILKDGKRLEDAHGHPVKFEDHVLNTASQSLDFKTLEDRQSPNAKPNPAAGKNTPAFVPKNEADYQSYLAKTDVTPAEKTAVIKAWSDQQSSKQ